MGDRNNPIKFGPEWLRNLARERSGSSASNSQSTGGGQGPGAGAQPPATSHSSATANATGNTMPKVLLAKLRYGREEMLALYDRSAEAPPELIYNEALYQPRGKPPIALNNTFEDEVRDPVRSGQPLGGLSSGDRFGMGRGLVRGSIVDPRGRGRSPFVRQTSVGRGVSSWHANTPRAPGYSGPDDDAAAPLRTWSNGNGAPAAARSAGDQSEWPQNKMFRTKRPGTNTNWRQARDEDEWRATDSTRPRSMQPDKWERDWGDRPNQDKPQTSWGSNRRPWVGGDEDNLPEWAVDNAEACGGTFDSSGAFHGYSNDDTNLPKQDGPYQLTRSHTHGSFARSKTAEEGSEEWWASEKAKKLSPKRFDAIEIKFKKPTPTVPDSGSSSNTANKSSSSKDVPSTKPQEKPEETPAQEPLETSTNLEDFNKKAVRFAESKTFDALMRSDINLAEASDERGNFQSVMITPNNSLRQKHQNIVSHQNFTASVNTANRQNRKSGILQILQKTSNDDAQSGHALKTQEDKVVEDIVEMTLEDRDLKDMLSKLPQTSDNLASPGMSSVMTSRSQHRMSPVHPSQSMAAKTVMATASSSLTGIQHGSQPLGMTNCALNASLGLPSGGERTAGDVGRPLGMPLPGVPPPVMPSPNLLPTGSAIPFPNSGPLPPRANNLNTSLFLSQANNNTHNTQVPPGDIPMPNIGGQSNMFPMHGLQHSSSQNAFSSSIYSNIMQQPTTSTNQTPQDIAEQWYYEDPKKNIQGPFSSRDMFNWYQAGFFTPSLMVRRATDAIMRPLGSYGPAVPFAQMDMLSPFPLSSGFEVRNQGPHESLINPQQGMGLDVMNMSNMGLQNKPNTMDPMQYGAVGLMRSPQYGQQQMDSLWSQPAPAPNMMWMQQAINPQRNETRVNNLPMFFWDQQQKRNCMPFTASKPSTMTSNLRPDIPKEMKTEDEILAQLRGSQNNNIFNMPKPPSTAIKEDSYQTNMPPNMTPNLDELEKFMQEKPPVFAQTTIKSHEPQVQKKEVQDILPPSSFNQNVQLSQAKEQVEAKVIKQAKADNEKPKIKESPGTKKAAKKLKDDKKEDNVETKTTEEDNIKIEKRSAEPSPAKPKKEDKVNKKELEKEKKEWLKEGFTIVKAQEKAVTKENKKKNEDIKIAEEIERRRKEEEKAALEDKKLKNLETFKKQQETQKQQRQQQAESLSRKAPWSAVANQTLQDTNKDGLTLAEIQRLEREKKLLQMKEQQQMMQALAQQQAAALAREQEMQANLGWVKKKGSLNVGGQSLSEIQAEARKQSAAAAAAATAAQATEEPAAPPTTHAPWSASANGGNASSGVQRTGGQVAAARLAAATAGFWDTQLSATPAPAPEPPAAESKKQKKVQLAPPAPAKKEPSPAADFETWCITVLTSWGTKIDVPTFVGFLKDIESPYEVKDYVKCYLGESRDSSDFARQFLERRSKLLRVGMVTPSDDLCSPAVAVNPRTTSGSDYQEVKGKGKKTKKGKMLKVDARILGFSVTAAEDRINVGDIDTA